jgi:hypothetical protein
LKRETLFSDAVEALQPGASGSAIAALLNNKVDRTTVANWRAGRRSAPQWALRVLADHHRSLASKHAALADQLYAQKERPGLKAGALNLARWRARKQD